MTKEEAATILNGNQYRDEGSKELFAAMREARLVAVFGASDDLTIFAGAMDDEQYLGDFPIGSSGLIISECEEGENCPYFAKIIEGAPLIQTDFSGTSGFQVTTKLPHARFIIMEDDEQYGEGLVFSLDDVA